MTTATSITVRVPLKIRRRPGRKTVVMPVPTAGADSAMATRADPALVKALARAFRWKRMLDEDRYVSLTALATAEKVDRGYLGRILQLTLLAPDIVEAILDGQQPAGLGLPALTEPISIVWTEQHRAMTKAQDGAPSFGCVFRVNANTALSIDRARPAGVRR
jgi:hypothetical protein